MTERIPPEEGDCRDDPELLFDCWLTASILYPQTVFRLDGQRCLCLDVVKLLDGSWRYLPRKVEG